MRLLRPSVVTVLIAGAALLVGLTGPALAQFGRSGTSFHPFQRSSRSGIWGGGGPGRPCLASTVRGRASAFGSAGCLGGRALLGARGYRSQYRTGWPYGFAYGMRLMPGWTPPVRTPSRPFGPPPGHWGRMGPCGGRHVGWR